MAERHGARPLTQRRFEEVDPSPTPNEPPAVEPPAPDARSPRPSPPPIRRDPSDLELRARQLKWLRERERAP